MYIYKTNKQKNQTETCWNTRLYNEVDNDFSLVLEFLFWSVNCAVYYDFKCTVSLHASVLLCCSHHACFYPVCFTFFFTCEC